MNTAVMGPVRDLSPKARARLAGALFLLTMVLGGIGGSIAARLVVSGDAAATAGNILGQEGLFRLGYAVYLVEMACQVAMTMVFYELLKPVSRSLSLLMAVFSLVGCIIKTLSRLFFFSPFFLLGGAQYLSVFSTEQLQALAYLFLRLNHQAETIAMVFFGLTALVQGYLIFRSGFLPRVFGVLSALGGLGWLTYLYEPLAVRLLTGILAVAILGALSLVVWLLVVGVNEQRWKELAAPPPLRP